VTNPDAVIEVEKLWTRRGGLTIHRDLNLRIARREIVGIVGGSGSGKTTLLRVIIGLDAPAQGRVRLFGVDPLRARRAARLRVQRRFGTLFRTARCFRR